MGKFRSALILLALATAVLSAQTVTTPPADAPAQSKASVYVYRYKQFVGSALQPSVYCDDTQLARMENGRYFAVKLPAPAKTAPAAQQQAQPPQEPAVREVVLTDTPAPTDPQTSLGDAARVARQKKQAASNSAVSNPQ